MENEKLEKSFENEVLDNEERLRLYIHLLSESNSFARLTGPSDEDILWNEHLMDCAAALPLLPHEGNVIDVGTGGGLPGMVWAVCRPELHVTLLDSIAKKCALVEKMAENMGLANVTVVCARSEDYAKTHLEKFAVAAARAVSSAGVLAEYLAPFVKVRGHAIAFKGQRVVEEIEEVGNSWKPLGFASPKLTPYTLGEIKRYLLVWTKVSQTTKGIPRRAGMAEKFPWYKRQAINKEGKNKHLFR